MALGNLIGKISWSGKRFEIWIENWTTIQVFIGKKKDFLRLLIKDEDLPSKFEHFLFKSDELKQ